MSKLTNYITLGRTGLGVSPLCLGTMTFGTEWGFGVDEKASRAIFDRYIEAAGNFIDTADGYTNGTSEKMVGRFITERGLRDRVVLATKFTFNHGDPGNPNAGGNSRKNAYRALEGSLRNLQTDYVDLYWLHAWDTVTPVDEVVNTLSDLVRAGKIRYYGFSDTPAWYIARAYTLAEQQGKERLAALQHEYSLIERSIEREHIPAAQQFGLAVCPWGTLGSGFLSGKYRGSGTNGTGEGRLVRSSSLPVFNKFKERNWRVLEVLLDVSQQMGRPPAQVAQSWALTQPGITSVILGATNVTHLEDSISSIEFEIPAELRRRLNEASALESIHPYMFYGQFLQNRIHGGADVRAWSPAQANGATITLEEKEKTASTAD
jgi:aryl-alcohol dehydrogenase-like predicted oxidoreductase